MWQIISNISAVVTCFLFILYIVGHIWKVIITKESRHEKFEVERVERNDDIEEFENRFIIDDYGDIFSISSSYGIRKIKVYEVSYKTNKHNKLVLESKKMKKSFENTDYNETIYIRCVLNEEFPDVPDVQFEIERADYTKVTFDLIGIERNKHGYSRRIIPKNYSFKMTPKSFLYYLCA